ncbi:MAG: peptide ABC transporter substrate-binding protein [Geminicoccaceae bacterium]
MIKRLAVWFVLVSIGGPTGALATTLTIGTSQFPSTLHPNLQLSVAKSYIQQMTMRPITAFDPEWELACFLCTDLPTLENGGAVAVDLDDGTKGVQITYSLHPDAVWGDGTPVSTDDVLLTWEIGRHPKIGIANQELYRDITDIDVIDQKTFRLHVRELDFRYNAINDFRLIPAHLEREIFEQDPERYAERTTFDSDPTHPGLAFGPYRITEIETGAYVVLEINPTWWAEPPAFERIIIKTIENTSALASNLVSGDVDMIAGELGLPLDQAISFEAQYGEDYNFQYEPGLIYEHLDLNLDNPILADRRVRQALIQGVDRAALSTQLFDGRQPVAHTSVHPLDWVYTDDVPVYERNVDEAIALLEQAGWKLGADGIRRNDAGDSLSLTLMTTAGNQTRERVQQFLQSQWKEIGVEIRIQNQPPRVFFGETVSRRKFSGMALFAWISSPENPPRSTLHSEEIPTDENGFAGQNYTGYSNPEMDELLDAIELELDPEARKQLWHEIQRIYATDLPAIPLYFRANAHIWPHWLEGVTPTGHQNSSSLYVENWRRIN